MTSALPLYGKGPSLLQQELKGRADVMVLTRADALPYAHMSARHRPDAGQGSQHPTLALLARVAQPKSRSSHAAWGPARGAP